MTSAAETAAAARERAEALAEILAERILVLDGATGTWLQGEDLTAADFGGEAYEGCNEHLVLTKPDVVRRMHERTSRHRESQGSGYMKTGARFQHRRR